MKRSQQQRGHGEKANLLSERAKIYSPSFVFISSVWNLDVGKCERRGSLMRQVGSDTLSFYFSLRQKGIRWLHKFPNCQCTTPYHKVLMVCTMYICPGSFVFVFIFVSVFVSVFALFVFSLETGGQGVYSQVQWGSCVRRGDTSH